MIDCVAPNGPGHCAVLGTPEHTLYLEGWNLSCGWGAARWAHRQPAAARASSRPVCSWSCQRAKRGCPQPGQTWLGRCCALALWQVTAMIAAFCRGGGDSHLSSQPEMQSHLLGESTLLASRWSTTDRLQASWGPGQTHQPWCQAESQDHRQQ